MAGVGKLPKKFEEMTRDELVAWLNDLRAQIAYCEDAEGLIQGLAEELNVDISA